MIQKIETFNVGKFLAAARDAREQAIAAVDPANLFLATIRDAYRMVMDENDYTDITFVETTRVAADLHAELFVAAGNAYTAGASKAQIDYIVSLCAEKGDFAPMGYTRLTARQASSLIDDLQKEVA